ncbi:transporter [Galbibacter pacificus]|uniref:Transporter n=1 Tax=Galbibacter pacificus TaxID=2996052 RepID=A0ABT6FSR0_9FLAO|nr:transporter [Galbibacter pacificus]MDG3582596.1 transporter [Galbibacter pacificus]MDG3586285.1 transporter [Galbibacter pacificus]
MKLHILAILCMATTIIQAQEETGLWTSDRPDGHAPISVMGDHTHSKGDWMFSYRYMHMNMKDLHQGSSEASMQDALSQYMVTPKNMPMNMHMLGIMYAPSNKITLMAMANYQSQEMELQNRMGNEFNTASSGFGDLKISVLYTFFNKNRQKLHAQVGFSFPTGSINQEDVTPMSAPNKTILPYPMQIGSGTLDANLGLTYLKEWDKLSFGSQLMGIFRTGENSNDYLLGNEYSINNWMAVPVNSWLSFSGRVKWAAVEKIHGANPDLNPMMVVTADTANSGKTYAEAGLGFNLYAFKGSLKDVRFGFEATLPIYQNMNGIQLKNQETLTFGLQYSL